MRLLTVIAAAVASLLTIACPVLAQTERDCRLEQRWILVTVTEERHVRPGAEEYLSLPGGSRFLRLCDIEEVRTAPGSGPGTAAVLELRKWVADVPYVFLVLRETPRELCAVIRECSTPDD